MARRPREGAREALLEAAREEFARRGLERARVEDIAQRAGISKGAFYLHFTTKEDAFREIVSRFLGALQDHALRRDELEARAAGEARLDGRRSGAGLARRLEAECAVDVDLLEVLWRNRQILAAVESASGKLYRELVGDFRRRMRALVSHRAVGGVSAGEPVRPDVSPEVIADIVVGTYEEFARRMVEMKEKPDLGAWARALLVVLYQGILQRPPALRRGAPRLPPGHSLLTRQSRQRSPR